MEKKVYYSRSRVSALVGAFQKPHRNKLKVVVNGISCFYYEANGIPAIPLTEEFEPVPAILKVKAEDYEGLCNFYFEDLKGNDRAFMPRFLGSRTEYGDRGQPSTEVVLILDSDKFFAFQKEVYKKIKKWYPESFKLKNTNLDDPFIDYSLSENNGSIISKYSLCFEKSTINVYVVADEPFKEFITPNNINKVFENTIERFSHLKGQYAYIQFEMVYGSTLYRGIHWFESGETKVVDRRK